MPEENKDLLTDEELEKEPEGEEINWEAEAKKARATAKRYHTSHKQLQELKKAQAEAEKTQKNAPVENKPESKDSAAEILAARSYLNSIDVKHREDQEVVLSEAKRLQLPVDEVSEFDYIKEKLRKSLEARTVKDALPAGSKRSIPSARNTAEYYLGKMKAGEISFGDIPDPKIRREVRRLKEKGG